MDPLAGHWAQWTAVIIIQLLDLALCLPVATADTKQIELNGTTFTYVEDGQGAPVVLVHGALGDYCM
jgi:hypothetical protein